jgi:hypothetical protein
MIVGYVSPYCGEGLPDDEACPCQAIDDDDPHDRRPGRSARPALDRRRRDRMQAAGPVESFTVAEIGDRDGWVCGICQDMARLVDASPGAARALSPSIDHVIAVSDGGPHARANVRIAHLWCNVERNNSKLLTPEYMRAQLSWLLDGTPVPEELHRSFSPSRRWPASLRVEYMIAIYCPSRHNARLAGMLDRPPAPNPCRVVEDLGGHSAESCCRSPLRVGRACIAP